MTKEVQKLIRQLKQNEIDCFSIPEEYENEYDIAITERLLNQRTTLRRGYDVISDRFFTEEKIIRPKDQKEEKLKPIWFDSFQSYFDYLNGDIYDHACYYQLDPDRLPLNVDLVRLFAHNSFLEQENQHTVDYFTLFPNASEQEEYDSIEKKKPLIRKWIDKFNSCTTADQLTKMIKSYNRSTLKDSVDVCFYFWNYIFLNINSKIHFNAILDFVAKGEYPSYKIHYALLKIFDIDTVIENYRDESTSSKSTKDKNKRAFFRMAEYVKNNELLYAVKKYYDPKTHYYCVKVSGTLKGYRYSMLSYERFFERIDDFITFVNGDLRHCDLSGALEVNYDFSNCVIDKSTRLPITTAKQYRRILTKRYDNGKFLVKQEWVNDIGTVIKKYEHKFDFFCDFVAFLKGDLSNADLVSCNGLINLISVEGMNLSGVLARQDVSSKLGISFKNYNANALGTISFDSTEKNEETSFPVLQASNCVVHNEKNGKVSPGSSVFDRSIERIFYISDIHLCHLIENNKLRNWNEIIFLVREVAETIINESGYGSIVLINGDTSLDITIFKLFVDELAEKRQGQLFIFTIGNHEIWSLPDATMDQIVAEYREILQDKNMYLLHNEILLLEDYRLVTQVSENEILSLDIEQLRARVRTARLILFGGTGFSGYNEIYNASYGFYRYNKTIGYSLDAEIKETRRFEGLYEKICQAFEGKAVIVMTHMPLTGWCRASRTSALYFDFEEIKNFGDVRQSEDNVGRLSAYQPGFIYTSGHTHQNFFYDDGEVRIYNDNQFGYNNKSPAARPHLKYFETIKTYDYFLYYSDGIYQISANDYRSFYRGKNIMMEFNRDKNPLFMIKKNGYYLFIIQTSNNTFYLLNGGGFSRRLFNDNLQYYFDHMDEVISQIKDPLADYTNYQKQVSEAIKQIGGDGTIHGCIVDIDFYNHVFVNYVDRKITGYWATDTVYKIVFPSIPQLLKQKQPALYKNYQRLVSEKTNNNLVLFEKEHLAENTPTPYYDTDIYKMSRQICKLQRLHSSILTVWPKESYERNSVEKSNKKKKNNNEIPQQKGSRKYEIESNESEYNLGIETSSWDSSYNEMEHPVLIEGDPLMKGLIDDDFPGTIEELIEKYRQEDADWDSDTSLRDFS